jgi:hypothetical protein
MLYIYKKYLQFFFIKNYFLKKIVYKEKWLQFFFIKNYFLKKIVYKEKWLQFFLIKKIDIEIY